MGELHCTDSTRPAASTSFCQPSFFIYDFSNSISPFFIADKRRRNATVCNVSTAPESDAEPHRDAGCSRASPHNQLPEVTVRRQTLSPRDLHKPRPLLVPHDGPAATSRPPRRDIGRAPPPPQPPLFPPSPAGAGTGAGGNGTPKKTAPLCPLRPFLRALPLNSRARLILCFAKTSAWVRS